MNTSTAAKAIGWVSLGLGAAELIVPGWLQRQLGDGSYNRLMRIFGVREMLATVGVGGQGVDAAAWSRMAAETIDLMGIAGTAQRRMQDGRIGTTLMALAALTALDAMVARGRLQEEDEARLPRNREQREQKAVARPRQSSRRAAAKAAPGTH
ncbi:MAG: hypothetical protein K0R03_52 [Moraxellaceae bacterium]|nr:hypothetical protein [Moraxellaceae bacterium]MDF3029494.1 hypothetical protein [Moraxellaceae bacterium]